jgi:hypothetical protein
VAGGCGGPGGGGGVGCRVGLATGGRFDVIYSAQARLYHDFSLLLRSLKTDEKT